MNRRLVAALLLAGCGAPVEDADQLCAVESELRVCPYDGGTLEGIDVSIYQSTVDWHQVKASGRVWAIARVSNGTGIMDTQFNNNWRGIRDAGMYRGLYQYFRPGQDGVAQAELMLQEVASHGGFKDGDLPPVMDIETTDSVTDAVLRQQMQAWLDHVEAAIGRKPVIYTANFMSGHIGGSFTSYPMWVANYGATCPLLPTGWTDYIAWQYTSTGGIPGVPSTNVDHDIWNGDLASLHAFTRWPRPDGGAPDAGARPDAGSDAGVSSDAGTTTDAGVRPDAGTRADAGAEVDSGVPVVDAGTDAGQQPVDAGVDGGDDGVMGKAGIVIPSLPICGP